jgi:hypothetical protein
VSARAGERIPWPPDYACEHAFASITELALGYRRQGYPDRLYIGLLTHLEGCVFDPSDKNAYRGATFKQLALIAHRAALNDEERKRWYEVGEILGLTGRHAGHIISRMDEEPPLVGGELLGFPGVTTREAPQ